MGEWDLREQYRRLAVVLHGLCGRQVHLSVPFLAELRDLELLYSGDSELLRL